MAAAPKRPDESSERVAALEAQVANLWEQLRRVEEATLDLPAQIAAALARHEDTCVGRSYVLAKLRQKQSGAIPLRAASEAPPRVEREVTRAMRRQYDATPPTDDLIRVVPPWKIAIYAGLALGAAVVAAVMVASRLGLFDLVRAAP